LPEAPEAPSFSAFFFGINVSITYYEHIFMRIISVKQIDISQLRITTSLSRINFKATFYYHVGIVDYYFYPINNMLAHQEKCEVCGRKVPQYFWFMLSGALCDVGQAVIDFCIYNVYTYEWERATVCWTLSYTLSIIVRHSSHRILVFGDFEGSYCYSLAKTYLTYSSSIIISMFSNHIIVTVLGFNHRDAWIITMIWTGIYNYFMLKASWKKPKIETKQSISAMEEAEDRKS